MNAAQLIAELQKFPPDMRVLFSAEAGQVSAEILELREGDEWNDHGAPVKARRVVWLDGGI